MLLALTTIQTVGVIIFCTLVVQWGLAFFCLMRLYKNSPRLLKMWKWNIIVLFGILIGPILYLTLEKSNPRISGEFRKKEKPPENGGNGGDYSI